MNIILQRGKGYRVENGHPWVFGNEIDQVTDDPQPGDIVDVLNFRNQWIGRGYYNPASQIAVRLLTRDHKEQINRDFFLRKITSCKNYREKIGYRENYRLVFGEGDFLPALVIDRFGEYFVLQTLSLGMEKWKNEIVSVLQEVFFPKGIYERNDVPVRKLEGMEEQKGFLSAEFDTKIISIQDGISYELDLKEGQKTGFFLDQRESKKALKHIAAGAEVLDCFCYNGSFSMAAAFHGAKKITGIDISEAAIAQANKNAKLNKVEDRCEFVAGNSFDLMPQWIKEGRSYDVIITDPPAFTKNRKGIDAAVRGYKEINLRSMKLLKPGGFLLTFSCSHFMSLDTFFGLLKEAATDAGRTIRQVTQLQQAKDHPVLWDVEETFYLKGFVLQVL